MSLVPLIECDTQANRWLGILFFRKDVAESHQRIVVFCTDQITNEVKRIIQNSGTFSAILWKFGAMNAFSLQNLLNFRISIGNTDYYLTLSFSMPKLNKCTINHGFSNPLNFLIQNTYFLERKMHYNLVQKIVVHQHCVAHEFTVFRGSWIYLDFLQAAVQMTSNLVYVLAFKCYSIPSPCVDQPYIICLTHSKYLYLFCSSVFYYEFPYEKRLWLGFLFCARTQTA